MSEFYKTNSTKTVYSSAFVTAVEKAAGRPVRDFFSRWLESTGLPDTGARASGAAYLISSLMDRLNSAVLVYGTTREAGANRYAAEVLQKRCLDRYEHEIPVLKDFEVTEDDLRFHDLIYIGGPRRTRRWPMWPKRSASTTRARCSGWGDRCTLPRTKRW